ncbi:hypothetical protein J2Z42_001651 [Clostridium algifaecis]|uniref:YvrJ family protein n=1 Tax=Clostridium algifaecis TaxID=1472040 RepID=A0ABS4KSG2_9CLOT|nr:YvrJ family protein [Clostridium algifaecis]MBP2032972.1 hypothetical protein [Clostridium algifaecis]
MYDQLISLISTVGFPIAVSIYLLVRFENKIDAIAKSIQDLRADILAVIKEQKKK